MYLPTNRTKIKALLVACAAVVLTLGGCEPPPHAQPEPAPEHHTTTHHRSHGKHHAGTAEERQGEPGELAGRHEDKGSKTPSAGVPEKAVKVLRHVDEHGRAPEGYEGGRDFHNAGANGEKGLPKADAGSKVIAYREWDVNPTQRGVNRGAERLVTGSDGSAYYTDDHYRTFTKIR